MRKNDLCKEIYKYDKALSNKPGLIKADETTLLIEELIAEQRQQLNKMEEQKAAMLINCIYKVVKEKH